MNFAENYILANRNKLPEEKVVLVQSEIHTLTEAQQQSVLGIDLKDPVIALILSLILGGLGIDRFFIGDNGKGIGKLVLTVLGWLTSVLLIGFVLLAIVGVWTIVDWFLIMRDTRETNFTKIMNQISFVKATSSN